MDFWGKNIDCLRDELRLKSAIQNKNGEQACEEADKTILCQQSVYGGNVTTYCGVRLHSGYSPENEAQIFSLMFQGMTREVILFVGFGNGYIIREVLRQLGPKAHLVIYEPLGDLFIHTMNAYDISDILSDSRALLVVNGWNQEQLGRAIGEFITKENKDAVMLYAHPQYSKLAPEAIDEVEQNALDKLRMLSYTNAVKKRFVASLYYNDYNHWDKMEGTLTVEALKKQWPVDIPVIIVGAGPSLDKNVEQLKEASPYAIIIALDSALPTLQQHEIPLDFYIVVESQKPLRLFDAEYLKGVPIICRKTANPVLQENVTNPKYRIYIKDEVFVEEYYAEASVVSSRYNSYGNVGTSAFAVAAELGTKNIILVGQDLCFSESGVSHSEEVSEKLPEDFVQNESYMVEAYGGNGMVQSRHDWYGYLHWTEDSIASLEDTIVINATEGGARIHGTVEKTLKDTMKEYKTRKPDIHQMLSQTESPFHAKAMAKIIRRYERYEAERENTIALCKRGKEVCSQILTLLEQENKVTDKMMKLVTESEQLIKKCKSTGLYKFIEDYRQTREMVFEEEKSLSISAEIKEYFEHFVQVKHEFMGLMQAAYAIVGEEVSEI